MSGDVIEHIAPPVTNFVDGVTINTLSDQCVGPELNGLDDGLGSAVWTANRLIFIPLAIAQPITVSQFFWINGTVAAGNTDVGIFSFEGTAKLGSSGSTLNVGTSVLQAVDVVDFTLPGNSRYWMTLGCDDGTHTFWRGNLLASGLDLIGVKEQLSGWSSGLPSSITLGIPTVSVFPLFGFTGRAVI